ncbi:hypothetical protein Ancab_036662 [Ancistrocladus abbreviatus]
MQAAAGVGGGGGQELNRGGGGLSRFRSAPATWLEALLEDDLTAGRDDPLKPLHAHGSLTQLLTADASTSSSTNKAALAATRNSASYIPAADPGLLETGGAHSNLSFHRQNSSPAEFLTGHIDGYFSSFGIPASYDYIGSSPAGAELSHSGKRFREGDSEHPSAKFAPHIGGDQGGQLSAAASGLLDMDMEKLLEDSVPCRVRAKRGCATHPRSIAERVRRTRISDRIRKLQELVPNMDKQTNTADMLEEAVEYVKHLQKQIQWEPIMAGTHRASAEMQVRGQKLTRRILFRCFSAHR